MTSRSKFIFKAPFNPLSFGQVSYNLSREMWRAGLDVSIFPISDSLDLSCYDNIDEDFKSWILNSINNRYENIDKNTKTLQLWHLRNSDNRPSNKSYLYTFHEIEGVTEAEKSICGLHEKVIFSSSFSKENFINNGVTNVDNCFVGFDEDIKINNKKYIENCIHFVLIGKWEERKNTELIIKTWIEKFGNINGYLLTCLVENPFFSKEMMSGLINNVTGDKNYFNVTFLPRLKTNSEMVDLYNSCDIDLSGLSSGEGWNLPSFNSTCLGKWSCVSNNTAHKDWADKNNCILVDTNSKKHPYDNYFFKKGEMYNQGYIFEIQKHQISKAIDHAIEKYKNNPQNTNGEKLKNKFSYKNMLNKLLQICEI